MGVVPTSSAQTIQPDNMAKLELGAIILPSSQSTDVALQVENAVDGSFATKYVSAPGDFPKWVEASWSQPVSVYKVIVDEDTSGRSGEYRVDACVGGVWQQVVAPTTNITPAGKSIELTFTAVQATKIRYYATKPAVASSTAVLSLLEIQVCGSADWVDAQKQMVSPYATANDTFLIQSLNISPSGVVPGNTLRLTLNVMASTAITNNYAFLLKLYEKTEGSPIWGADYTVATKGFTAGGNTSTWAQGSVHPFTIDIVIPDWAPHGDIPLYIRALGRGVEGKFTNVVEGKIGTVHIHKFATDPVAWPAVTPQSEVRTDNGQPRLYVNSNPVAPYIMTENSWPSYKAFGEHAKSGAHVWRVTALKFVTGDYGTPLGITEAADHYKIIDQQIKALLREDPDAYIIVCALLRPSATWTANNPNDACWLADGQKIDHSLSSRKWASQVSGDYRDLVAHLMAQNFSGHVIGIQFEVALETYYPGYMQNAPGTPRNSVVVGDYSPEHILAFRYWLTTKYNNDVNALRSAWKDSAVTFNTAYPDINVLRREDVMAFKNPSLTRMPMDYWEFHSYSMALSVTETARAIKEASGGKYVTGFWGLYSNGDAIADIRPGKAQHIGCWGLKQVLDSPYVDYIAVLQAYTHTQWGTPMVPITLAESVRKHHKMLLVEYDVRTFFTMTRFTERTYSQRETLSVLYRDAAAAATRGYMCWWVGFPEQTTGRISVPWYAEESLLSALSNGRKVYKASYQANGSQSVSQVAVFINNADIYGLDVMYASQLLCSAQYNTAYFEMPKLGAPTDYYLLDDIALANADQYKVFVFLNAYSLTARQRELIKQKVRQAGKTAVWLYAPGFSDTTNLSTTYITDLTGFTVGYESVAMAPVVQLESGHLMTKNLPNPATIQPHQWEQDSNPFSVGPVFYVNDPSAEVLGRYSYNNKVAYAVKQVGAGTSVYLGIPFITSDVLRDICRASGVHLYSQQDVYLDASRNHVLITTQDTAYHSPIRLPGRYTVYDVNNRRILGRGVAAFVADVPALTTGLYFVGTDAEVDSYISSLN